MLSSCPVGTQPTTAQASCIDADAGTILLVLLQVTALIPASTALQLAKPHVLQDIINLQLLRCIGKKVIILGTAGGLNVQTTVTSIATAPIPCPAGYYWKRWTIFL